ncbi:peptidase family M28 family [Xylariomycetidae sp. FL2044]|nr:peptidase family M28 family [Xylariomycetidae sp. FL2044]
MGVPNPVGFRPFSVTFWTTITYLAILIPVIIIHETVPPPPDNPNLYSGINFTKSWTDLTTLSRYYHPFNSHENDNVHNWILLQLQGIKERNQANDTSMVVFEDMVSNITATGSFYTANSPTGTYFEGTNIMVYIRGKADPSGSWWDDDKYKREKVIGKGGVLINAHYDSVSTGFGATDDGMGCVTVMTLVDYFSRPENRPERGIVALLNNNEEDFLWGAQAFGKSPLMPFCHTFLNLEGAGAGGRSNLFRTTDTEVTAAYKGTKNPFGTVISSDAFGLGAIRSNTDYVVFNDIYGIRGLDLSFYRPRARYHTNQDDAAHASRASLWHMLSNSLHTMKHLSGDASRHFIGERSDRDRKKVQNGKGSTGVWFDIFGQTFALFELRTLFAWSLTLLIVTPLTLMLMTYLLIRNDKYYFFSARKSAYEGSVLEPVMLGGRRGIIRFPLALIVSSALVVGSAYLVTKVNPLIVYSSEYAVWAMMLSLFYFAFWTIMAGANFARPSALHRGYAILWLFVIGWAVLVANTVFEDRFRVAAGYIFVFYHSAIFVAAFITLCELFALPTKTSFAQQAHDDHEARDHLDAVPHADDLISPGDDEAVDDDQGDDDDNQNHSATETTPLVGGRDRNQRTTFATRYRRSISAIMDKTKSSKGGKGQVYDFEQEWSGKLPSWLWWIQFLVLGPFLIILVGQNGLSLVAAVSQTGADGSSFLLPYLVTAFFSILLLIPITPFMHRVTHHIPILLLFVFVGTLIYNLAAFPFSENNRYKIYFQQSVDLDTGASTVKYTGIREFVEKTISELPSAIGKEVTCEPEGSARPGLTTCFYDGSDVPPDVVKSVPVGIPPQKGYDSWVQYNITRDGDKTRAQFEIDAEESRSCAIAFEKPISSFQVEGGSEPEERFGSPPESGLTKIKLYRRDWETPWKVNVEWQQGDGEGAGMDGRVICSWDDVNDPGNIPAFDESLKYSPTWVAVTKMATGLLEGSKPFKA